MLIAQSGDGYFFARCCISDNREYCRRHSLTLKKAIFIDTSMHEKTIGGSLVTTTILNVPTLVSISDHSSMASVSSKLQRIG